MVALAILPIAAAGFAAFMFAGVVIALAPCGFATALGFFGLGALRSKFDNEVDKELYNIVERSFINAWKTIKWLNNSICLYIIGPLCLIACPFTLFASLVVLIIIAYYSGKIEDAANREILSTMMEAFPVRLAAMLTDIEDYLDLEYENNEACQAILKAKWDNYQRVVGLMKNELRKFQAYDIILYRKNMRKIEKYHDECVKMLINKLTRKLTYSPSKAARTY